MALTSLHCKDNSSNVGELLCYHGDGNWEKLSMSKHISPLPVGFSEKQVARAMGRGQTVRLQ